MKVCDSFMCYMYGKLYSATSQTCHTHVCVYVCVCVCVVLRVCDVLYTHHDVRRYRLFESITVGKTP